MNNFGQHHYKIEISAAIQDDNKCVKYNGRGEYLIKGLPPTVVLKNVYKAASESNILNVNMVRFVDAGLNGTAISESINATVAILRERHEMFDIRVSAD